MTRTSAQKNKQKQSRRVGAVPFSSYMASVFAVVFSFAGNFLPLAAAAVTPRTQLLAECDGPAGFWLLGRHSRKLVSMFVFTDGRGNQIDRRCGLPIAELSRDPHRDRHSRLHGVDDGPPSDRIFQDDDGATGGIGGRGPALFSAYGESREQRIIPLRTILDRFRWVMMRLDGEGESAVSALKALRASVWWFNRGDPAAPTPMALTLSGVGELSQPLVDLLATLPVVSLDLTECSLPASIAPALLFRPELLEVMVEEVTFPATPPPPAADTTTTTTTTTTTNDSQRPFSFLATLINLQALVIDACPDFCEADLMLLASSNCPHLRRLALQNMDTLASVNALRSCDSLQALVVVMPSDGGVPAPYCDDLGAGCWQLEELGIYAGSARDDEAGGGRRGRPTPPSSSPTARPSSVYAAYPLTRQTCTTSLRSGAAVNSRSWTCAFATG